MRTDITGRRLRRVTAVAVATTFLSQNFAWAICSDGLPFPPGNSGYDIVTLGNIAPSLNNMTPHTFTGTAGSVFVPDNSTFENNDPSQPSTVAKNGSGITYMPNTAVGGHNWEFDQGSTTCKAGSTVTTNANNPATPGVVGGFTPPTIPGQAPSGWFLPPNTTTDCFVLPVVKTVNGQIVESNFGVIPLQSQQMMFLCNPANLSAAPTISIDVNGKVVTTFNPNPLNTRMNQIGCSIQQLFTGSFNLTDQTTGDAYMVTSSIMGGMFTQKLVNTPNGSIGDAGRVISELRYFNDIPDGTKLTNTSVSPDGHYALSTSIRRNPNIFVCNMPFGDPGRIDAPPVDVSTFAISYDTLSANPQGVKCLTSVATTGLQVTLTNIWAPDNQPYMGGQRTITSAGGIGNNPGSIFVPNAWPQCIIFGKGEANATLAEGVVPVKLPAIYPYQAAAINNPTVGSYQAVAAQDFAINDVFHKHSNGGCQNFGGNAGFSASPVIQPQDIAAYTASNGRMYMFSAGVGQPVVQARLTQAADGTTHYAIRTYFSNANGFTTGIGVAPDMNFTTAGSVDHNGNPTPNLAATGSGSLIVMTDPTGLGLAGQEIMSRLPLCEDF